MTDDAGETISVSMSIPTLMATVKTATDLVNEDIAGTLVEVRGRPASRLN